MSKEPGPVHRLAGLPVLAGYLATGALAVSVFGTRGQRHLAQNLVLAAAIVTFLHYTMRVGGSVGLVHADRIPPNFEGFSGNRNAYAVQMLLAVSAAIVWLRSFSRLRGAVWLVLPIGTCLFGLFMSQSRAGLITAVVILGVVFLARAVPFRMFLATVSAGIVVSIFALSLQAAVTMQESSLLPAAVQPDSDSERWLSITAGVELWLRHPLFGAGLGAFVHEHAQQTGNFLVIHNSLVWLLAEFGIVGTLPWIGFFASVAWTAWASRNRPAARWPMATVLVLITFALPSFVHDLLYQRLMWLLLGSLMAVPDTKRSMVMPPARTGSVTGQNRWHQA